MREPERLDVKFKASMSKTDNCICSACHGTGTVMKLTYPETKFHDGKKLSTKYYEFWICEKCREKLSFALNGSHTIDAVPVVRCRECKHLGVCGDATNLEVMGFYGYCSRGERKEGADNDT